MVEFINIRKSIRFRLTFVAAIVKDNTLFIPLLVLILDYKVATSAIAFVNLSYGTAVLGRKGLEKAECHDIAERAHYLRHIVCECIVIVETSYLGVDLGNDFLFGSAYQIVPSYRPPYFSAI